MNRSHGVPLVICFICFIALSISVVSIQDDRVSQSNQLSPSQVDQLWANALWETLLAFEDDAHEDRMAEFFTTAIEHAEDKAPMFQMGLKKHRNVPYDELQGVGGLSLMFMSFQSIKADGSTIQFHTDQCKLADISAALKKFTALEELKVDSRRELFLAIMRGEVDLVKWEQDFANQYLREPPEFFAGVPAKD